MDLKENIFALKHKYIWVHDAKFTHAYFKALRWSLLTGGFSSHIAGLVRLPAFPDVIWIEKLKRQCCKSRESNLPWKRPVGHILGFVDPIDCHSDSAQVVE